jgi:hypothetical protein
MFPTPKKKAGGGDIFDGLQVQAAVTPEALQAARDEVNQRQTTYNLAICCIVLFCAEASRGLFMSVQQTDAHAVHTSEALPACVAVRSLSLTCSAPPAAAA